MNCPTCGLVTEDADRFCSHCGAELSPKAPEVHPAAPEEPPTLPRYPAPPPQANEAPYGQAPPQGNQAPYGQLPPQWASAAYYGPVAPFGAPLASWWQRVGSLVLDQLILWVPYLVFRAVLDIAFGHNSTSIVGGISTTTKVVPVGVSWFLGLGFLLTQGVYFTALNGQGTGQTLGNRGPGIAVRDADTGEEIGPKRGFIRWVVRALLYCAVIIPGIVNDLMPLFNARRQSIADKVANSVVIRVR